MLMTRSRTDSRTRSMPCRPSLCVISLLSSARWLIAFSQATAREKITLASKPVENDRRNALHAELDSIREQQSSYKTSRGRTLDQLKALQDGIQRKVRPTCRLHECLFDVNEYLRPRTCKPRGARRLSELLPRLIVTSSSSPCSTLSCHH